MSALSTKYLGLLETRTRSPATSLGSQRPLPVTSGLRVEDTIVSVTIGVGTHDRGGTPIDDTLRKNLLIWLGRKVALRIGAATSDLCDSDIVDNATLYQPKRSPTLGKARSVAPSSIRD